MSEITTDCLRHEQEKGSSMLINTWYSGKDSELPRKLSIAPTKFLNIKAGGNKMNVKKMIYG